MGSSIYCRQIREWVVNWVFLEFSPTGEQPALPRTNIVPSFLEGSDAARVLKSRRVASMPDCVRTIARVLRIGA